MQFVVSLSDSSLPSKYYTLRKRFAHPADLFLFWSVIPLCSITEDVSHRVTFSHLTTVLFGEETPSRY